MKIASMIALGLLSAVSAHAQETTTYKYDARGRLTEVKQQGGPASGTVTTYSHDAADNRTNVTVTTTGMKVIVVPLNGFTVIPIG